MVRPFTCGLKLFADYWKMNESEYLIKNFRHPTVIIDSLTNKLHGVLENRRIILMPKFNSVQLSSASYPASV